MQALALNLRFGLWSVVALAAGAGLGLAPDEAALREAAGAFQEGWLPGFIALLYNGFLCF